MADCIGSLSSFHLWSGFEEFVLDTGADRVAVYVAVNHRVQAPAVIFVPDYFAN